MGLKFHKSKREQILKVKRVNDLNIVVQLKQGDVVRKIKEVLPTKKKNENHSFGY